MTVTRDSQLALKCTASGSPLPEVYWTVEGTVGVYIPMIMKNCVNNSVLNGGLGSVRLNVH